MDEQITIQFLGTGGSMGVPVPGCDCAVCHSTSPYDMRLRPSIVLRFRGQTVVVDVTGDFRFQALRYGIHRVDGIFLTHTHEDHVGGLDDMRIFSMRQKQAIPTWMSEESLKDIQQRFGYFFRSSSEEIATTKMDITLLRGKSGTFSLLGEQARYFSYAQAGMKVNGLRLRDTAYVTDLHEFDASIFDELKGVKTLIVSALRYQPSRFHLTVDESVAFATKVGVERAWFTHIAHELPHLETNKKLPNNMQLAYDGLMIEVT